MMRLFVSLLSGGLFGLGLMVSGMTDTTKVQGWLDFFGDWDPTLAFVLGGAILPMLMAWRLANRHGTSILGSTFPARPLLVIDSHLLIGSVLFGIGWALVGLCPGPAMAALSYGGLQGLMFMAAMVLGMLIFGFSRKATE